MTPGPFLSHRTDIAALRRVSSRVASWLALGLVCLPPMNGPIRQLDRAYPVVQPATRSSQFEANRTFPVAFEVNEGQTDSRVRFVARLPGYSVFLTAAGATFVFSARSKYPDGAMPLPYLSVGSPREPMAKARSELAGFESRRVDGASFQLRPVGAARHPSVVGLGRLPGKVNYLIGDDPRRWHTDISTYARVEYRNVYPGIDLVYRGTRRGLEYDWVVQPGARPEAVRLFVDGPEGTLGTRSPWVDRDGNLVVQTRVGRVVQSKPVIYQLTAGSRKRIAGGWFVAEKKWVGFRLGHYDRRRPLVIDPVLKYSRYLGGSSFDFGSDVAVDASGNAYIAGTTGSLDFPTYHGVQGSNRGGVDGTDGFITKLNPTGDALSYSTYIGGRSDDYALGLDVDASGNVYLTGWTASRDFPGVHPLRPVSDHSCNGGGQNGGDAFIIELSAAGDRLIHGSCFGGTGNDTGMRVALDPGGDAYVIGTTTSDDFPNVHAFQVANRGNADAFVAKVDLAGSELLYSTYLGGSGDEAGKGIAVDAAGNATVTGSTDSPDFPTHDALQTSYQGGKGPEGTDAFVARLDATGKTLVFSTYLGGTGDDVGSGVAVDSRGNAYVTGATSSSNFPTQHALRETEAGQSDAFVAKLSDNGDALVYSTYLGGRDNDEGLDLAVDGTGSAYITGFSRSLDFPTVEPVQPLYGGGYYYGDAFVTKMSPDGQTLIYSTYLGGKSDDVGMAIAVNGTGNAYVTGGTSSLDFPIVDSRGLGRPPRGNGFIAEIAAETSSLNGQPSITIDRVAILHRVKGSLEPTNVVRLRENALFVVLYHERNAGQHLPSGHIRFVHAGRVVYSAPMKFATAADGTPYFSASRHFQAKRYVGHLVARVTLRLSSASDAHSLGFTLTAR